MIYFGNCALHRRDSSRDSFFKVTAIRSHPKQPGGQGEQGGQTVGPARNIGHGRVMDRMNHPDERDQRGDPGRVSGRGSLRLRARFEQGWQQFFQQKKQKKGARGMKKDV